MNTYFYHSHSKRNATCCNTSAEKFNKFRYEQTLKLNNFINLDGPRQ